MSKKQMVKSKQATFNTNREGCIKSFLSLTKPMHKMTSQEINILTLFLVFHYEEKDNFTRESDLWKFLFDYDTKLKIKNKLNIGDGVFQNTLTSLRKKGIIKNNRIVPYFILNIDRETETFELIFRYNLKKENVKNN